ncbi:hypothetical protein J5N58_01380 [Rhizobium cremeum]|uniref:hypothetical protein n=1 Tax=Rhizobium cremeum TaxID=2813827 RepID=UPI000DDDF2FF|nr:hypothetical protein [Rhizobium cremeum]MCJ7993249.1 hypothetical protein [Rhizobium cremeum]MCJ7998314.1 hypothetical protein [Rhizobium cremeum]
MTSLVNKIGLLAKAIFEANQAEDAIHLIAIDLFPPGSMIKWERGDRTHMGTVIRWAYGHCWARNTHTGREVKISARDVARAR